MKEEDLEESLSTLLRVKVPQFETHNALELVLLLGI